MSGPSERFATHLAQVGSDAERDWARAALAEGAALPAQQRRAWLRGAAWFLLRERRPTVVQVGCALAGAGYGLLLVLVPLADLRDDAPDVPFTSDVAVLVAGVALVVAFALAAVRPLLGALVAALALPASVALTIAGRQAAFSRPVVDPPAGLAPIEPPTGATETVLALVLLVGVPALALAGAVLPLNRRRSEPDVEGGVRAPAS